MFSHIHVGITDFERAFGFYSAVLGELNLVLKFNDPVHPWAAWMAADHPRPLFVIGRPFDNKPATPGNGHMPALLAESRSVVDRCYAIAIELGGSCEGPPGLRPQYHADYYGAYFRDLDDNKLCVCCHTSVED